MDRESVCSVRLSWLLDKIVGTEEEVKMRRKASSMVFYTVNCSDQCKTIYSGSRGEGLEFESSDTDIMMVYRGAVILNSVHDKESADPSNKKMVFLIRREGCSPGFVLLQYLSPKGKTWTINKLVAESIVDYHDIRVVSSAVLRDEWVLQTRSKGVHTELHGPCATAIVKSDGEETDLALCFACFTWPSEAYNFIHRHRLYEWPRQALIDKIVQNGCHLVAIGDPNSEISHLQWRLSFSAAEKLLVHSFNHTQLKVYGLLKIFLTQAINTEDSVRDLLCSYFLKTAVFYSIETTPQSFWAEDLLISCFWFCFNKLITWVEQGNCPNYFVPENNMFGSKVYGERRQNLLLVLNRYKRQGWTCLCQCTDLKQLKKIVKYPQIGAEYHLRDERDLEMSKDIILFRNIIELGFTSRISTSLQMLTHSRSRDEEDIASFLLCIGLKDVVKLYMSNLNTRTDVTSNKSRYLLMRKCKRFLSISTILDLSTRYLTDATFFYTVGNYKKSLQMCEQMLSRWKPYVACIGWRCNPLVPPDYMARVCGRNLSVRDKMTKALASDIVFGNNKKEFYPKELQHDMHISIPIFIPPLPYMVFLVFLCHHQLGNIASSLSALHDLRTLVDDEFHGGRVYYVVFNLLAICLQKLGDVRGAIEACLKSLQRQPNMNGAATLLDELIRKSRR